ncbi:Ras-related protein Rab-5B [Tritrichomonas foetus]|uniref:Ras-related protein Rab-5B n=1 Tax=Tritrichomonas foetus TaxID=1144522 RepID=A0A1J4K5X1_9EUKA|nr:Ras-related protein Rab-5B [Tritrichomonas foetus]|eukprot:OHT06272.1 Ras-related protein Rab-5B [Tritrichomonas foetus]
MIKTILLGDMSVGKSSIALHATRNVFFDGIPSTIGAATYQIRIDDEITFNLWDTAGNEKYRCLTSIYFNDAKIALLVFDISKKDSFVALNQFYIMIKESVNTSFQIVLVGNKVDLVDNREIQIEEAMSFADSIKALYYIEVSAKTGYQINTLFQRLASLCYVNLEPREKLSYNDITKNNSCC